MYLDIVPETAEASQGDHHTEARAGLAVTERTAVGALERAILEEHERFGDVGFSVAVVRGDEILLEKGFGLRHQAAGLPVTERTLFAIASSTKPFTATLVGALVGDGLLEWNRPVREYLPRFKLYDPVASEQITPLDLLCHNSGLPTHDFVWYGNQTATRGEIVEQRLRHLEPNRQFRQAWQYNNLMFLTAGHLAAEILGCTWEEAVRERLLEPLGMSRTGFSAGEMAGSDDWSRGYRDEEGKRVEVPLRDLGLAGPAGSINSCASDMAAWLRVNLNDGRMGDKQVIAADTLKTLHTAHMHMPAMDDLFPERYFTGYGLGWFLESYRGERVLLHPGHIDGFSAMVLLAPRHRVGVVVLSNGHGTYLGDAIAARVLDMLLDLEPLPWGERYHRLMQSMRSGGTEATRQGSARRKVVARSHPLDAYAGTYNHAGYGDIVFEVVDGSLHGRFNSLSWVADHRTGETFEVKVLPGQQQGGYPATFRSDAEGEISSLVIPFDATVKAIEFKRVPPALTPAELELFTGEYAMGEVKLSVFLEKDHLSARMVPALGAGGALVSYRDTTFRFKEAAGVTVEFVMSQGKVDRVIVNPIGVLTPVAAREGLR